MRKQVLGRGLDAILGSSQGQNGSSPTVGTGEPLEVAIERVSPGRGQPRRRFDDEALEELASSIREKGILQPLVVVEAPGGYELIAGERRLRAAARAGLEKVPVIVKRDVSADELVELALIENIQREDLTPLEQARAFQRLIEVYGHTQEEAARRVGKSRAAVANAIRLLGLPAQVRELLEAGVLAEGHGRALLALTTAAAQIRTAQRVARKGLSVRDTEELVRLEARRTGSAGDAGDAGEVPQPSVLSDLERSLMRALATKVRIRGSGKRGSIRIEFYSDAELDRLAQRLATC